MDKLTDLGSIRHGQYYLDRGQRSGSTVHISSGGQSVLEILTTVVRWEYPAPKARENIPFCRCESEVICQHHYQPWKTDNPTVRGQLTDHPTVRRQLTDSTIVRGQLTDKPTVRGQLTGNPTVRGQLTDSPTVRGQRAT